MRRVFGQPGFPLLFTGLATSMLGDAVMLLVLSIWVRTLTGSNAQAGLTFFFMVLPALGAPLLGVWVDRLPRRPILVWGNLASAVAVLPLVLVRSAADVWIIWAVAFLYGVSFVVLPAALNGLLKDLLPEDLLVDANASLATTKEGFRLFGPLVGAALFSWTGGWVVAVVDATTFALAALLVSRIAVHEVPPDPSPNRFRDEVTAGLRFLANERVLRRTTSGLGLAILVVGFFEASIYALLDSFGRPPTFAGVFVTVQGVGAVLGGVSAGRCVRRIGEVAAISAGLATMAAATAICALARDVPVVLTGAFVLGVALPLTFVAEQTLLQRRSPRELMGRVSAAVDVLLATPQALSLAVGSLLVSLLDWRTIFWIIVAVIALAALQVAVSLRDQIRADVRRGGTPAPLAPVAEATLQPSVPPLD